MGRRTKRVVQVGVVAGATWALWRAWSAKRPTSGSLTSAPVDWVPQPFPFPPEPRVPSAPTGDDEPADDLPGAGDTWVEPDDGACPVAHPVKVNTSSGIFHVEGGASYERTHADRCYRSPEDAEADGFRAAKI